MSVYHVDVMDFVEAVLYNAEHGQTSVWYQCCMVSQAVSQNSCQCF